MSDAILVGEGWISEHYFTTDATSQSFRARVLARRKSWDEEAKEDRATPRSRFVAHRQDLEKRFAALAEHTGSDVEVQLAAEVYETILEVLELGDHGLLLKDDGPISRVSAPGITERAPLNIIRARPAVAVEDVLAKDGRTLAGPVDHNEVEFTSVARLVSALFVDEHAAPELILVLAGRWAVLAEQERWAEGRYLAVDLQLVCERNDAKRGGEIDQALTCLSYESIAPDADGNLWWTGVFEESVKHTVGVSKDLRDGVRLSIEILANEVVTRRRDQGLDPLPAAEANELAKQSLRFLYRILFLLYAEASPELGVLPVGAPEYDAGYSLDRLRELVQVELVTPQARTGTHLYESLGALFRLVDQGHLPDDGSVPDDEDGGGFAEGLTFHALRADLFRPRATRFIDAVGLGNAALQEVLAHLLLSKEKRGRDRGFISYAELGINQLGAVYEGLMSYTGFFAETDLYEVAKGGDASKGSWVVPVERADGIAAADFVRTTDPVTGEAKPVLHRSGSFVFRLAGRERQQSASYYTPEVLTRFTVGQALEELLDQDGVRTTAAEILELTVCEPALGSGAFAIEAVRQLAEQYLTRRQDELGKRIDPDEYPRRRQEVKAYLALHNVYGVDLNATAVELAEISLWLDTMVAGLPAPWFGLHLRRGNSLIGARRAVYSRQQVANTSYRTAVPRHLPLTSFEDDIEAGRVASSLGVGIHHFLVPAEGWGAAVDAADTASIVPERAEALRQWRAHIRCRMTKSQLDALVELGNRVEATWRIAYRRLSIAESEIRRSIPIWGASGLPVGGAVSRERIEHSLKDISGAYQRLRRVMDAWCALWFWPLAESAVTVKGEPVVPPSLDEWIAGLQALLGRDPDYRRASKNEQFTLASANGWDELGAAEELELSFAGAESISSVLERHPWLVVCERIASRQGFFHWSLEFARVFADRGGFDLQIGNPPWVRPDWKPKLAVAEFDARWVLNEDQSDDVASINSFFGRHPERLDSFLTAWVGVTATRTNLASGVRFPFLRGLRSNLYRCFVEQAWSLRSDHGVSSFVHPESHFTDENADEYRRAIYQRLRRHWQFKNELRLFETGNQVFFGVHVYGAARAPHFMQASHLYHPDTIDRSLVHNGEGKEPGMKDDSGSWDIRPHANRIIDVTVATLSTWAELLEGKDPLSARMVYIVNRSTAKVLDKINSSSRLGSLALSHALGWDGTAETKPGGRLTKRWAKRTTWDQVVLQGPAIWISTPLVKIPNATMRSQNDWAYVDLELMPADYVPPTCFERSVTLKEYRERYKKWEVSGETVSSADFYRVAWRSAARSGNERTLMPAIIPPGSTYITQSVYSAGLPRQPESALIDVVGWMSSLLADLFVRSTPKASIPRSIVDQLPFAPRETLMPELRIRALRLNCLTAEYATMWANTFDESFRECRWTGGVEYEGRRPLAAVHKEWTLDSPLRLASDRRQALVEIDALVALMLGVTADELSTIYRTQFSVLYGYDQGSYLYDANGRLVPNSVVSLWRKREDRITEEERTAVNQAGNTYVYELPFVNLDREKDMRVAYEHFEHRLAERS
ncbi:class I SAM-dependent DNA methyltransferase [Actinomycetospora soli]|uniref:class I SAM-dependent DNA methyltransferase n=1 Tax=Actinomycetospora soli TaxID=2893887 RepID=UPI001E4E6C44|nr:class I SAM-dependent DNA methyltransferase [Actinomycetospora soli]MCD2186624.1 class I SAM-dependent DNA methyltransferase [Actinomycetospora soli]